MRHSEFWTRMEEALGASYARHWAGQYVIRDLGGRTAHQALEDGVPPKEVWRAVWAALELPARDR
jgi:hypothetical protein